MDGFVMTDVKTDWTLPDLARSNASDVREESGSNLCLETDCSESFRGLLVPSREVSGCCLNFGHSHFLPIPSSSFLSVPLPCEAIQCKLLTVTKGIRLNRRPFCTVAANAFCRRGPLEFSFVY